MDYSSILLNNLDKAAPIILVLLGYFLKRTGAVKKEAADHLINLVFYVFLPASIFHSLLILQITNELLLLPLAGFVISLSCYLLGYAMAGFLGMNRKTTGTFLIACGSTNQGLFSYPFFLMYLGTQGLSYVAFYDMGQIILIFTLAYYFAIKYGEREAGISHIVRKMLSSPVLWAFAFALGINVSGLTQAVAPIEPVITMLHNSTIPLVMIALGIFVEPRIRHAKAMAAAIFVRFGYALAAAYIVVLAFNLQGPERLTALAASTVPPAMFTLVYSVEEGLDVEYASALLSVCVAIGLVYTPLLFSLLL
ncbi:MAG: AEC family transporter [Candidatus Altiarchaeia archaeon]